MNYINYPLMFLVTAATTLSSLLIMLFFIALVGAIARTVNRAEAAAKLREEKGE